ncbi:hypothetical protein F5Y10DRAFT_290366 [Nemania abortiva]|nr:hypothetical protein F5Y10DRAFT_290366 [Nemania abortiva]
MSGREPQNGDRNESGVDDQTDKPSNDGQEFAWKSGCQDNDQHRIFIKEAALEDGIKQCEKLIDEIKRSFDNIENLDSAFARSIWSPERRKQWISECEEIINDHQNFRVLVGVSGRTGSGKTSALNALLGYQELLPTNNEEAATAVPCRIEYNNIDDPAHAFRCHVTFRKRKDLKKQLDEFFEALGQRNELRDIEDRSFDDEIAFRDYNAQLKPVFELIKIVFGIHEEQAEGMDTHGILSSRPEVLKLLGTTKEFYHHEPHGIADKIKPYMDSTEADHSKTGLHFAAWPLIDQVDLFVKSDILKNGVVLVDLPGVADAVESRSAVAERYSNLLTATLVVVEAKRAASDSTNVSLMNKHREMEMMLNGKFHKRSFCVCVSQIDSIDRTAALKKKDARDNGALQSWINQEEILKEKRQEMESKKKEADKLLKTLEKKLTREKAKVEKCEGSKRVQQSKLSTATSARDEVASKRDRQRVLCKKLDLQTFRLNEDLKQLGNKIVFTCIAARTTLLETKISNQFRSNQARLVNQGDNKRMEAYDGSVSICPISARAFWNCRIGEEPSTGFPREVYTGIPNLANWIRTATIPEREEHVDALLNRLQTKYNIGFDGYWSQLYRTAEKINPLNNRNKSFEKCSGQCADTVKKWPFKNPDNNSSSDPLHWISYRAMVIRRGANSYLFLNTIVKEWNQSLNHDIPALAALASPVIDKIWDDFLRCLEMGVETFEMSILKDLRDEMPALECIRNRVKDKLRRALKHISQSAINIHPGLVKVVQKQWEPGFAAALRCAGSGSHKARQEKLLGFAQSHGQDIFQSAFVSMQDKLSDSFKQFPAELAEISSFAIREVQNHINVLLDKIIEPTINNPVKLETMEEMKIQMQQSIQATLLDWDVKWKMAGRTYGFVSDAEESKIPKHYQSNKAEQGNRYDSDEDTDVDMDTKTASKPRKGRRS